MEDPERFGVVRFEGAGDDQKVAEIIEKPSDPPSNSAVTGIYLYDADVFEMCDGLEPSAWLGHSATGLGDINGDGYADFAFSRRVAAADATLAYVVYSTPLGSPSGGAMDGTGTIRILGQGGDSCPCTIKGIGDFNGDGFEDMVLSAQASGEAEPDNTGRVYLFMGDGQGYGELGGTISTADADYVFDGEEPGDRFGQTIARAGDLNADGYMDLAISAPGVDALAEDDSVLPDVGRVYIFFGFDDAVLSD